MPANLRPRPRRKRAEPAPNGYRVQAAAFLLFLLALGVMTILGS